jgi:hypothetical protein
MSLQTDSVPRVLIAGGGVVGLRDAAGAAGARGRSGHADPRFRARVRLPAARHRAAVQRRPRAPRQLAGGRSWGGRAFVSAGVEDVDTEDKSVGLSTGERLGYDALVLAVGAEALPALDQAITRDDRSDSEVLGGLVRDVEDGYTQSLAVVIPPGPGGRCAQPRESPCSPTWRRTSPPAGGATAEASASVEAMDLLDVPEADNRLAGSFVLQ